MVHELTSYPLIFQKKDSNTRKLLESYLKENNITLTPIVEVVSQDLICEFVNKGIGVGFVLEDLVDEKYKELEKVKIKENIKTDIYIANNKFINPTFAAEKFLTLIK